MPEIYLLSTILMGAFLIAIAMAISRSGQRATPATNASDRTGFAEWSGRSDDDASFLLTLAYNPAMWAISFVVLAFVFIGGAVLLIQGIPGAVDSGLLETGLMIIGGLLLGGYLFFGTFFSLRDRMGQTAAPIAIASAIVGLLGLLAVLIVLLMN